MIEQPMSEAVVEESINTTEVHTPKPGTKGKHVSDYSLQLHVYIGDHLSHAFFRTFSFNSCPRDYGTLSPVYDTDFEGK